MRSSGSRQKWPVATLEQEVHGIALLLHQMARVLNAADLGELAWPGLQDRSFRSTADILHVSIVAAAALHHRVMSGAIYGCHAGADGCMNARFSKFPPLQMFFVRFWSDLPSRSALCLRRVSPAASLTPQ